MDLTPPDHATALENIRFDRAGEAYTREGVETCLSIEQPFYRMFLATPAIGGYSVLFYDGNITIWRYDIETETVFSFYSHLMLRDFAALNMYGRTYVLPMGDT